MNDAVQDVLDEKWMLDRDLSLRLPRSWTPFFGRFGRLLEVQRATVPPILDGQSVLVCAPTAAGKTEASCAPLLERLAALGGAWTVLYISPTRALVNDLYARLCAPVEQMRLRLARRTGDHHDPLSPQPHVLLTTPESFDSMLCRQRTENGHALAPVRAVVLDEIHLLHGSPRGEQLRWLLERLRRVRRFAHESGWVDAEEIQVVGLSATVPDPQAVLTAYFPAGSQLVAVGGAREIEEVPPPEGTSAVEDALPRYLGALNEPEKVLVFANARKRVDALAEELRGPIENCGYGVRAHHGSLSQLWREDTEKAAKTGRRLVLIATSTLEIGVDIGDVDLVVLDGPPPDMSAFLQRIGRGNRRTLKTRVMLCKNAPGDRLVQDAMLAAARVSYLGPAEHGPQYAVSRQQVASYIFQSPKRDRSESAVLELIRTNLPEVDAPGLLTHLCSSELVRERGRVRLGDEWLDASDSGEIHSNISSQQGHTVVDQASGDAIAHGVTYRGGKRLSIAGNQLDVTRFRGHELEVQIRRDGRPLDGKWSYFSGSRISGASAPQAVRRFLGLSIDEWPVLLHEGTAIAFHFGGTGREAVLQLLADREGLQDVTVTDWYLIPGEPSTEPPGWLTNVGPAALELLVASKLEVLERDLARPRENKRLPMEMRIAEVRQWLGVERQLAEIGAARWVSPTPEQETHLRTLLSSD